MKRVPRVQRIRPARKPKLPTMAEIRQQAGGDLEAAIRLAYPPLAAEAMEY